MSTGLWEDIALYLDNESTRLTRGVNLFAWHMPEGSTQVSTALPLVALIPIVGFQPLSRFVGSTGGAPAMTRPQMRVIVRSTDGPGGDPSPENAIGVAQEVHDLLDRYPPNSSVASGVHGVIHSIETWSPPYLDDRDDRNRYSIAFNCNIYDSA